MVSVEPTSVVRDIAFISSVFDNNVNWPPAILTSLLAAASISTPPLVDIIAIADSLIPSALTKWIVSLEATLLLQSNLI